MSTGTGALQFNCELGHHIMLMVGIYLWFSLRPM